MSMHRVHVYGGFRIDRTSCHLISTTDKLQLVSFTYYYSLFAARIIYRHLSMRYQSVIRYSISVPSSITYPSATVTYVYITDFDDITTPG